MNRLEDFLKSQIEAGYLRLSSMKHGDQLDCLDIYFRDAGEEALIDYFILACNQEAAGVWHRGLTYTQDGAVALNSFITQGVMYLLAPEIDDMIEELINEAGEEHPSLTAGERNR